jgi:methylglyoxal synthase
MNGGDFMNIALIAHDRKKGLLVEFCLAYQSILRKHNLCATGTTSTIVSDATGLRVERFLIGGIGGLEQIGSRIAFNEIDLLICFADLLANRPHEREVLQLYRLCDLHNTPLATNLATAEVLVRAIDRGDLDWRDLINPINRRAAEE